MFLIDPLQGFTATTGFLLLQVSFAFEALFILKNIITLYDYVKKFLLIVACLNFLCVFIKLLTECMKKSMYPAKELIL